MQVQLKFTVPTHAESDIADPRTRIARNTSTRTALMMLTFVIPTLTSAGYLFPKVDVLGNTFSLVRVIKPISKRRILTRAARRRAN